MVYNPIPKKKERRARPGQTSPPWQARCVTALNGAAELEKPLRRQGAQVGMDAAERWIALSGGGNGLENFLRTSFPRVEAVIVDFFHAAEYLGKVARAWYPADEEATEAWLGPWCHRLKHEGGESVLAGLRELRDSGGVPHAARVRLEEATTYFENQKHRMNYPAYQARG